MPVRPDFTFEEFREYFPYVPTALAIRECVRLHAMRDLECPSPILDVGCGDGLFARLAFQDADVWGIDIDSNEVRRAQASQAYSQLILADITRTHLPAQFFGSCIANCSLEHIPDIDAATRAILGSLQPGAPFYTFLPNRAWTESLLSVRALRKMGQNGVADAIDSKINEIFAHRHLEDEDGWRRIFEKAGFVIERLEPLGSAASTLAFEAFLLPSTLGWVTKKLTRRWVLMPWLRRYSAAPVFGMVRSVLEVPEQNTPSPEFLLVARRPA